LRSYLILIFLSSQRCLAAKQLVEQEVAALMVAEAACEAAKALALGDHPSLMAAALTLAVLLGLVLGLGLVRLIYRARTDQDFPLDRSVKFTCILGRIFV
jgi:hypothetical protein